MASELHRPATRLELANRSDELPRLAAWIEEQARALALPITLASNVNLVLEEWVVNIISYAYADEAAHTIAVQLWCEPERLCLEIGDDGRPFDPTVQALPDTSAPLDQRKIGGLAFISSAKPWTSCRTAGATVLDGRAFWGSDVKNAREDVRRWLREIDLLK
jgi:anti-sigma regulatory factor (Ser/Thr protein kinase)